MEFHILSSRDAILKSVIDTYGLPQVQNRQQGFAAMVHIILEQQVSIASAKAAYRKLENLLIRVSPETVLRAPDELFRSCGVSRQKTLYIKDLAQRVGSGLLDFPSFALKTEAEIRAELLAIKGVGHWSVEIYLMFCLQSPDILPVGDIAIRHAMRELYGHESVQAMLEHAENWKPHRTAAAYILWHHYLSKRGRKMP
jgi:DNA-3-methyladenine glycosylase II